MKDLQKKTPADLAKLLAEKREEVRTFRFAVAGSGTRDVRKVRTAKHDIARILTEQRRRRTTTA